MSKVYSVTGNDVYEHDIKDFDAEALEAVEETEGWTLDKDEAKKIVHQNEIDYKKTLIKDYERELERLTRRIPEVKAELKELESIGKSNVNFIKV